MRRVGVPYTDAMLETAAADLRAQAEPGSAGVAGLIERYGNGTTVRDFDGNDAVVSEMDALVAYLQILGRLTSVATEPVAAATQTNQTISVQTSASEK